MNNFIERLNKIIEHYKISSSEFAEEINVPRSSISHIISKRNKPSLEFMMKVKNRFPDLEWQWLIEGKGNMLNSPAPFYKTEEKTDYFSAMETKPIEISSNTEIFSTSRETIIEEEAPQEEILSNSQPLENKDFIFSALNTDNQDNKIKRIIIFYENGKFESFEP